MFKIDNNFSKANVPRTIRFTEKLYNKLNEIACQHDVSFNLLVLQCCQYALDHIGEEKENS